MPCLLVGSKVVWEGVSPAGPSTSFDLDLLLSYVPGNYLHPVVVQLGVLKVALLRSVVVVLMKYR